MLLLHFGYSIRNIIHKKSGCDLENGNKIWNEFSQIYRLSGLFLQINKKIENAYLIVIGIKLY